MYMHHRVTTASDQTIRGRKPSGHSSIGPVIVYMADGGIVDAAGPIPRLLCGKGGGGSGHAASDLSAARDLDRTTPY